MINAFNWGFRITYIAQDQGNLNHLVYKNRIKGEIADLGPRMINASNKPGKNRGVQA